MLTLKKRKLVPSMNFRGDDDEEITSKISQEKYESYLIELKNEGCSQAEAGDLRKALNIWQRAQQFMIENENSSVSFVDSNPTVPMRCLLHELKAQAYMELDMLIDAIREATSAVASCSQWPEGLLTLGRCQREIGEIELSIVTYESIISILKNNYLSSGSGSGSSSDVDNNISTSTGDTKSSSLRLDDVIQEMMEVKSLADEMKKRREMQLKQLQDLPSSATSAEREVCMCKFNLTARAKPNSLT